MKKLIFSLIALAGFVFQVTGQVVGESDQEASVPTESLILRQKQIPPAIVNEVRSDLISDKAFIWRNLPTIRDSYLWIVNKDSKGNIPNYYEAYIKVHNGGNIFVRYNPDGKIIESEIIQKNSALPYKVAEDLQKSKYKGWKVIGDKELIKYLSSKNNIEEHFRVIVEKDNMKKSITFNYNEPA